MKKALLLFLILIFALTLLFCSCEADGSIDEDDKDKPPVDEDVPPTDKDEGQDAPDDENNDSEGANTVCKHNYKRTVITEPKMLEDGLAKFDCSLCRQEYSETIPATRSIKLLCIGNSFSVDAVQHLYGLLTDAGVEDILIGNLYVGGCSLETHWKNISTENAAYKFYLSKKSTKSMYVYKDGATVQEGLAYADWDFITMQESSKSCGLANKYTPYLQNIINEVTKARPNAKLYWHMTWAYQQNSTHSAFPNYNSDQMTMYNMTVQCVKDLILTNKAFAGVIPSGTTVQNLRTSYLGDTLTRDGYHMSYGIGRYAAGMTYLATLTGADITKIKWTPTDHPECAETLDAIKDAVSSAMKNKLEVTKSKYPYSDKILNSTTVALSTDDRSYLSGKGLDPDRFLALEIKFKTNSYYNAQSSGAEIEGANNLLNKYLATQIFTERELPIGSVIRLDSGFRYRPEGWVELVKSEGITRPAKSTSAHVVVDNAWWGDFKYRAFNLERTDGGDITLDNSSALKIYVPIVKRASLGSEDISYLTEVGLNPSDYMLLDYTYFVNKYYNSTDTSALINGAGGSLDGKLNATEMLTRYDLSIGSIIRLDGDYRYRAEGWVDLDKKNTSATRPPMCSEERVTVSAAWWADFTYRAFNLRKDAGGITAQDCAGLKIYVKVK